MQPPFQDPRANRSHSSLIWRGPPRVVLLALLWWVLTEGDPRSWLLGAPAVLAGTWASLALAPPSPYRLRIGGLIRFVPFFFWRSLAGGIDVAWRALHPGVAIDPSLERYLLRLPQEGPGRALFVGAVSLLPGTLSANLHENHLIVHVLRSRQDVLALLEDLEEHVAAVFGQPLGLHSTPSQ